MSMLNGDEIDLSGPPFKLPDYSNVQWRMLYVDKKTGDVVCPYPAEFDPRPDLIHPFED